jgi:UDP-glucose 4-epimerase
MKALVTGGYGFLGSHLSDRLTELGYLVDICDIKNEYVNDIRDRVDLGDYDIIFHLAYLNNVMDSFDIPEDYFSTNVYGAFNIFEMGKNAGLIINASSTYALDSSSPYGMSLACSELMADKYDNVITIRLPNMFGPNQSVKAVIPSFITNLIDGNSPEIYGYGSQTRDFTYVDDVVSELIVYAENGAPGVHEIGYGEERTVEDIFILIKNYLKSSVEPTFVSSRAVERPKSKALEPFQSKIIGFDEGLKRTIDWYIDNHKGVD